MRQNSILALLLMLQAGIAMAAPHFSPTPTNRDIAGTVSATAGTSAPLPRSPEDGPQVSVEAMGLNVSGQRLLTLDVEPAPDATVAAGASRPHNARPQESRRHPR
jgi:hypothetical protein